MLDYVIHNLGLLLIIVSILYVSDYFLTYTCSKLYHHSANTHFSFEGGIELNPLYRKDFIKPKIITKKIIIALLFLNIIFWLFWEFCSIINDFTSIEILFGAWVLTEIFIHTRHFRNFILFSYTKNSQSIKGKIEYSRQAMHHLAAMDSLIFAVIYFIFFLLFIRLFFLFGVFGCLLIFLHQKKWLKKYLIETNSQQ